MDVFGQLSDEETDALLDGGSDVDQTLASVLAGLRSFGERPVNPDLAARQASILAAAARLASPSPKKDGNHRPLGRSNGFTTLRSRSVRRAVALGLATVLLGGGVAAGATGNLPTPIQETVAGLAAQLGINLPAQPEGAAAGQATAVANQAFAEEMAANAERFAEEVQLSIGEYSTVLDAWTGCIANNASDRGDTQSDPATRTDEAFDPTEGCGDRPTLVLPDPADFGLAGPGAGVDAGPPEDVPDGPPEDVPDGPPAGVPDGPLEGVPDGPPAGVGPSSEVP